MRRRERHLLRAREVALHRGREHARRLAKPLRAGAALRPTRTDELPLGNGEVAYAAVWG
ncbi:hypothetical protein [Streptomyces boncukensis]|uniref:Uncharacterized protein n=1 Tax=Streptomyces boncukensis TaxID=2711219 RepID=A0A6G4WXQ9_9ACTN|nr:hypothetical protein [Streptomyces boncukensis]NGO69397.1 hypothetical protein [Streptomyces boncukensis]